MSKYIFVYKSSADWTNLPKEQLVKVMQAWGEWLGSMGAAVVDPGQAFKSGGKELSSDGVHAADGLIGGYTVVEAKDFDEALSLAQGSPTLQNGGKVEVYEAFGV